MNWEWGGTQTVLAIHDRQIAEHGGASGVRDLGLLESALARPRQLVHYENPDAFELAAAYGFGIIKDHAFVDGNKRTGYVTTLLFLRLNRGVVRVPGPEAVVLFTRIGAGQAGEEELAVWLKGCG